MPYRQRCKPTRQRRLRMITTRRRWFRTMPEGRFPPWPVICAIYRVGGLIGWLIVARLACLVVVSCRIGGGCGRGRGEENILSSHSDAPTWVHQTGIPHLIGVGLRL